MSEATIKVCQSIINIDTRLEVTLQGFPANSQMSVTATLIDRCDVAWQSSADFKTDPHGSVSLTTAKPLAGSYQNADPDGLFWSMLPSGVTDYKAFKLGSHRTPDEPAAHSSGLPALRDLDEHEIALCARTDDGTEAKATITRRHLPLSVHEEEISFLEIRGKLFRPNDGRDYPGVMVLSGSGGGVARDYAALLASHGFVTFALAYFNYADLPDYQNSIPLEYFKEGIEWFQEQVKGDRVAIKGTSKGAEAAQIIASTYPDLISGVIAVVPSDLHCGILNPDGITYPCWSHDGNDLPFAGPPGPMAADSEELVQVEEGVYDYMKWYDSFFYEADVYDNASISLEKIKAPILFVSGGDDALWPGQFAAERAMNRLEKANFKYEYTHVCEPGAGHGLLFPGYPSTLFDSVFNQVLGVGYLLGGSPEATAAGQRHAWGKIIEFLRSLPE